MRVLHYWDGRRGVPRRLQIDFVKKLSKHCTLHVYGKGEEGHNGQEISPISFKNGREIQSVADELKSDILLISDHAICKNVTGLEKCKIPTVMMEIDWYVTPETFYVDKNINYIIARGPVTFKDKGIESVYLPLSVDDEEFYTDPNSNYLANRKNNVAYIGSGVGSRNKYYTSRTKAVNLLNKSEYFKFLGVRQPPVYVQTIKEYIGALSCSFSELKAPPAKVWEIMACGSALLVSDFTHRELLFGNKDCMFIYKDNLSDIADKVKEIVFDIDKVKEYTKTAIEVVQSKHLDSHRSFELYNILKAIKEGKEVPKVWGF